MSETPVERLLDIPIDGAIAHAFGYGIDACPYSYASDAYKWRERWAAAAGISLKHDLNQLIAACLMKKSGDKDFALFHYFDGNGKSWWRAAIGNTCSHVSLGESDGEIETTGESAVDVVAKLLAELAEREGK